MILDRSLRDLYNALQSREISAVELTQLYLQRIQLYQNLQAYLSVDKEGALKEAKAADARIARKQHTILTGIPVAHKDNLYTRKLPTTCASLVLEHYQARFNATIVSKLKKAGAIMLGKTNMDEFAMGSSSQSGAFGAAYNPWDHTRVPGGSSGGSAIAVAAQLAAFATASDTGGSARQPAAFCGVCALKPTYGLISRFGMINFAPSLDTVSLITRSIEDLGLILPTLIGYDVKDPTSVKINASDYLHAMQKPLRLLKIGVPTCFFNKTVSLSIQEIIKESIQLFSNHGAQIVPINLKYFPNWLPCYQAISSAEAAKYLARITQAYHQLLGEEVKRRIAIGSSILSQKNNDFNLSEAQEMRFSIQKELYHHFTSLDLIIGPTTPTVAFSIHEHPDQWADQFTVVANLANLPALSIPSGFSNHLPVGMQLIAKPHNEKILLHAAYAFQQWSDWHLQKPLIS